MSIGTHTASVLPALVTGLPAAMATAASAIVAAANYVLSWAAEAPGGGVTVGVYLRSEGDERPAASIPRVDVWVGPVSQYDWMTKHVDLTIPVQLRLTHQEKHRPTEASLATLWALRCLDWAWLGVAGANAWKVRTVDQYETIDAGDKNRRVAIVRGEIRVRTTRSTI